MFNLMITAMKKIFLLPVSLLFGLAIVAWSCGDDEKEEDVCNEFPQCQVSATACCPEIGNCYYTYEDQTFTCDASAATAEDPDGCAQAELALIAAMCPTKGMIDTQAAVLELRALTRQLMEQARMNSVCM